MARKSSTNAPSAAVAVKEAAPVETTETTDQDRWSAAYGTVKSPGSLPADFAAVRKALKSGATTFQRAAETNGVRGARLGLLAALAGNAVAPALNKDGTPRSNGAWHGVNIRGFAEIIGVPEGTLRVWFKHALRVQTWQADNPEVTFDLMSDTLGLTGKPFAAVKAAALDSSLDPKSRREPRIGSEQETPAPEVTAPEDSDPTEPEDRLVQSAPTVRAVRHALTVAVDALAEIAGTMSTEDAETFHALIARAADLVAAPISEDVDA
jgi:hypothetical protein